MNDFTVLTINVYFAYFNYTVLFVEFVVSFDYLTNVFLSTFRCLDMNIVLLSELLNLKNYILKKILFKRL